MKEQANGTVYKEKGEMNYIDSEIGDTYRESAAFALINY